MSTVEKTDVTDWQAVKEIPATKFLQECKDQLAGITFKKRSEALETVLPVWLALKEKPRNKKQQSPELALMMLTMALTTENEKMFNLAMKAVSAAFDDSVAYFTLVEQINKVNESLGSIGIQVDEIGKDVSRTMQSSTSGNSIGDGDSN